MVAFFELSESGKSSCGNGGWQRCCKNEAGGMAADEIGEILAGGNIAADGAEGFGERSLNDINMGEASLGFGLSCAASAVDAHRMDFIKIGESIVFFCQLDNIGDGGDVTIHGIDRFKRNDFGTTGRLFF